MTGDVRRCHDPRAWAEAWRDVDPDPITRAAITSLLDDRDVDALDELFGTSLRFGTAGLRAPMGPGPARMNRVVVRRATVGLLRELGPSPTVVIGHDARRNSRVFALDTARVVAAHGGRALLLPELAPTPLVSFTVRRLGADAGVMCTASHNPPDDNGYKVYLADGAQVIPPVDARIAAAIVDLEGSGDVPVADDDDPGIERLDRTVETAYVDHIVALATSERRGTGTPSIVYSPLHGVGGPITLAALDRLGYDDVRLVARQARPDPAFPTVSTPNPELADTLQLALAEAEAQSVDVALVHDPDADRLAVVVPDRGRWRALTGNEIGLLLADHALRRTSGGDRLVVDTVVSSSALGRLAAARGVHHARTLTGFKWIVRAADDRPADRFVFGYEEALGYSVDAEVRDKDGIAAALAMVALVADERAAGRTVFDRLRELAVEVGASTTASWTRPAPSSEAADAAVDRLRAHLPTRLGPFVVTDVEDFSQPSEHLTPTQLLVLDLEPAARLAIRPSGTEAKVKVYAEVVSTPQSVAEVDDARDEALARLGVLRDAVVPLLDEALGADDPTARD